MRGQQPKIIISGGGTGGHIYPAIAIAEAIKEMYPETEILFVGAKGRMEMTLVPKAGYPVTGLWISGFQRKAFLKNILFPVKVMVSLIQSFSILFRFKPDAVIGVGGYASGPLLFAASRMSIPVMLQEQNAYPGITNKILGRWAEKIFVAFEGMERFFPAGKIILTGNPVRKRIAALANHTGDKDEARQYFGLDEQGRKVLLVLGGSLGARTINEAVIGLLPELVGKGVYVIWQCGKAYAQMAMSAAEKYKTQVKVFPFIDRMDLAYAIADVVISRAGALSITELTIAGKPAILVPSPNVAEDHQRKNAEALVRQQAALMIDDQEARKGLNSLVLQMLEDDELRQRMRENLKKLAKPHAARVIAEEIMKTINRV